MENNALNYLSKILLNKGYVGVEDITKAREIENKQSEEIKKDLSVLFVRLLLSSSYNNDDAYIIYKMRVKYNIPIVTGTGTDFLNKNESNNLK